jgi:anti-sigma B factor antagonist
VAILDVRVSVSRFGDDSFVVAAGGELDLHTVEPLREKLADVLEQGGRNVLVDLAGVTFIDSTTLGVLVNTARALRSSRGRLVIVADDSHVTRAIELSGLEHLLPVRPSLPEAVQDLVSRRSL